MSDEGEIFIDGTVSTKVTEKENFILSDVKKLVRNILDEYRNYEIKGICVSTAGVVNPEKGEIAYAGPTIPKYTGTKIKEELEKEFSISCEVENDVNCAGLGEYCNFRWKASEWNWIYCRRNRIYGCKWQLYSEYSFKQVSRGKSSEGKSGKGRNNRCNNRG